MGPNKKKWDILLQKKERELEIAAKYDAERAARGIPNKQSKSVYAFDEFKNQIVEIELKKIKAPKVPKLHVGNKDPFMQNLTTNLSKAERTAQKKPARKLIPLSQAIA